MSKHHATKGKKAKKLSMNDLKGVLGGTASPGPHPHETPTSSGSGNSSCPKYC